MTFTAADDCGNESDITLTFTIVDVTAPTLNVTSAVDVACETYSATGIYGATAMDICGDATVELVSVTDVSSGCPQYLHVYKAVDDCGNESATIDQVVSLVDEEDPVVNITCPANYAAYLDGDCLTDISPAAAGTATATATDNCSTPAPTVTYSDGTPTPGCGSNYSFVRTWSATAEDECGNSTTVTCDQTITVSDEIDPVITCPANVTVECDGMGNAADLATFLAGASATDNCDMDVDITNDYTALSNGCGATGSATVTSRPRTTAATRARAPPRSPSRTPPTRASTRTPPTRPLSVMVRQHGRSERLASDNGGAEASDVCGGVTWTNNHSALSDDCGATGGDGDLHGSG